ncbi:DUF1302 family protein [Rhodocyclus tenuis]|uniref:DUF1302 family protein n=1 Tax=Rhodocyclus tenuis TaxID=1066 RepID=UPI0019052EE9|nr:DUF1302 family protein [Rhodocyclus tenuis]MBK1679269.1 hypothetical protein [Rhodocyclus tenuis]
MPKAAKKLPRLTLIAALSISLGAYAADGRDSLFGDDLPLAESKPASGSGSGIKGFLQFELARTTATPTHWSKARTRADLSTQGSLGDGIKWKLGARVDYDAVYHINDFYPAEVERNQRSSVELRENYIDISRGDWDFRLGRQHVVWGEMVGLFFADVVSARDQREFILPEFDQLRTPQWAARAEYFADDFHAEALWIPVASYDNIGKPGAEFYPYQPVPTGVTAHYRQELRPDRNADNMNYGLRLSTLRNGWDVSGFYYRSTDINPTFYREFIDASNVAFQARHDRIDQFGGTVAKDFGDVVLKGEAVYTRGRSFTVLSATDADGVVRQNTLDWAAGLDFTLPAETRFNVQLFQRQFFDYNTDLISDRHENGYSLLLNSKFFSNWEAQGLIISSFNRTDWLFRPRLTWNFERNWRWILGADIFKGPALGMFGRYDQQDRVYSEVRYSF